MLNIRSLSLFVVIAVLSGGCAVGPDFHQPEVPPVKQYTSPLSAETVSAPVGAGASQRFVSGADIPGQWWSLFRSPDLDRVIRQALADSPTLQSAEATLRQSSEALAAETGSLFFPALDAHGSVTRQKISGAAFGQPGASFSPFTLYNASVGVTYGLDFFGGSRRQIEALRADADYQRYRLEGAHIALTANIVTAAVQDASLRAQIAAMQEIAHAEEQQLGIVERQYAAGAVALTDVLAQRTQLAQTRAQLPVLEKASAQNRHLLAMLAGRFPIEAASLPEFSLASFDLPQDLPVSLPSALVRQRPDIAAAEAQLHAASARVGVATAELYPNITLSGRYGSEASTTSSLFSAGSAVWNLGAGLVQPLFHGGALRAKKREAVAVYDQAAAQYRQTVLLAFENVADVLRALEADAEELKAQAEAESAARQGREIAQKQYAVGATSYLSLLNAERSYQEAKISLVRSQAARFADTAALFQALGGGWWNGTEKQEEARQGAK